MRNPTRTPRSQIRSALRRLFLYSRERREALRRDGYKCQDCGAKQSKAKGKEQKVECDHLDGIYWELLIDYIQHHLLPAPERLETVCPTCHAKRTEFRKQIGGV